ncbi:hypothetical protein CENDO_01300 [Corynebacterium endometrii]|uniref:Transcription regulator QacR C-terminal domain-containing protein n=1 Tax=Corynebacterium endometrii TaxID=2488819 RepID=A0A4P7QDU6_9CORY|nr:hypothetical protein CENDO_01300 [Corynebacterium endometrii]
MNAPAPVPLTPRQRELFNALLRDFLSEGFENFTIDSAVKKYHCSKSTIYGIGATRDQIISRILISYFKEIARRTAPQAKRAGSLAVALEDYFDAMTSALEGASPKFMGDLATEPVAREIYSINTEAAVNVIHGLIEEGVAAGEFNVDSVGFASVLIQRSMQDIQQGIYSAHLNSKDAYQALGQIVLRGLCV